MELTLTAGCWIKFCTQLAKVICPYNYYSLFCPPSYIQVLSQIIYDRLLPLFRQFLLIPNRNDKFMNLTANCATPCCNKFCWYLINKTRKRVINSTNNCELFAVFPEFSLRCCVSEINKRIGFGCMPLFNNSISEVSAILVCGVASPCDLRPTFRDSAVGLSSKVKMAQLCSSGAPGRVIKMAAPNTYYEF